MSDCIGLMEEALVSLARGEVLLPLRQVMRLPESGNRGEPPAGGAPRSADNHIGPANVFGLMPAYSAALGAVGAKLITVFPGNHGTGIDSHQGAVLLFDGERGGLRAIVDASSITAIRTAAVSGVATKLLAPASARSLAILGAGLQARTHIEAMLAVRPFETIRIWNRNGARGAALAADVERRHAVKAAAAPTAEAAVRGADVVCTVTASLEPVLRGAWLAPGTHVNAVGASVPTARELDSEAVRRSRLFVDRRESALAESGDILAPMREGVITGQHIVAELGELLTGAQGRRDATEITLFKSLGIAVEDLACAHFLDERARKRKAGTWVEL